MKTPRTEAVGRMAVGPMREYAIIEHAQTLERENIAMREALEDIGAYKGEGGPNTPWRDIVRDCGQKARDALANAR